MGTGLVGVWSLATGWLVGERLVGIPRVVLVFAFGSAFFCLSILGALVAK